MITCCNKCYRWYSETMRDCDDEVCETIICDDCRKEMKKVGR